MILSDEEKSSCFRTGLHSPSVVFIREVHRKRRCRGSLNELTFVTSVSDDAVVVEKKKKKVMCGGWKLLCWLLKHMWDVLLNVCRKEKLKILHQ